MPTYEYACRACGEHLEVVQSFTDDALTDCPNCGGALRKVFGNIGISFKGSGFYKNDSRSSSKSSSSSTPSAESKESPAKEAAAAPKEAASSTSDSSGAKKDSSPSPTTSSPAAAAS